jgi:hypothetical protein
MVTSQEKAAERPPSYNGSNGEAGLAIRPQRPRSVSVTVSWAQRGAWLTRDPGDTPWLAKPTHRPRRFLRHWLVA